MLGQGGLKADDTLRAPFPTAGLSSSGSVGKRITNTFALYSKCPDRLTRLEATLILCPPISPGERDHDHL